MYLEGFPGPCSICVPQLQHYNRNGPLTSEDDPQDVCAVPVPRDSPQGGEGQGEEPAKSRRPRKRLVSVKRSKSQDSSTKNSLHAKPKPKANGMPQFLRKPKQTPTNSPARGATPTLGATPTDMLIQFQIASMGCMMGVESRAELRTVVRDSETNSEKDNYVISQEREQ